MNVSFVNKYTVTREGHQSYHHLRPEMARKVVEASAAVSEGTNRSAKVNGVVRIMGMCMALGIVLLAVLGRMWPLAIIGGVLAGVYALRIYHSRQEMKKPQRTAPVLPSVPAQEEDTNGRWVRFVRFGDYIEVEDPGSTEDYQYSQITRISDDPAYLTLWMDNGTQVRVAKRGFTIGTLQGFEQFIMDKTNRMIGPAATHS